MTFLVSLNNVKYNWLITNIDLHCSSLCDIFCALLTSWTIISSESSLFIFNVNNKDDACTNNSYLWELSYLPSSYIFIAFFKNDILNFWNFSLLQLIELACDAEVKYNLKPNSGCSCEIKSNISFNNLYIFAVNL